MNKEKRNLSQPKERHKILNMKEEKNNIINDKKFGRNNLPKNLILPSEEIFLKSKGINLITSNDQIIRKKVKDKYTHYSNFVLNDSENNNYQRINCRTGKINDYLSIIVLGIFIAIIVYLVRIYKLTTKNPLENINLNNLNTTINSSVTKLKFKKNKFNESSFYDISSSKEVKRYLRYLDEDCQDFNSELKKYNYHIDKVFDLKFNMVHKTSLGLLIIMCINIGISILVVISLLDISFIPSLEIIAPADLFLGIIKLILLIILLVNYYKGNSTGEFLDFYEKCLDSDKKPYLMDAYNRLDKLNSNFTIFVVLNILVIILNTIIISKKDEDLI